MAVQTNPSKEGLKKESLNKKVKEDQIRKAKILIAGTMAIVLTFVLYSLLSTKADNGVQEVKKILSSGVWEEYNVDPYYQDTIEFSSIGVKYNKKLITSNYETNSEGNKIIFKKGYDKVNCSLLDEKTIKCDVGLEHYDPVFTKI